MPAGPSHHSQGATVAAVPRLVDAGSMCSVATSTRPRKILARGGRQSTLRRPPDEPVPLGAHQRRPQPTCKTEGGVKWGKADT